MSALSFIKKVWERILKSFVLKIFKVLAAIVIILVLIELGLRLYGHILVRAQAPDTNRPNVINADYLIACFGDSYTKGTGASSPNFSYPAQLERILNHKYGGVKIAVLNEAIGGLNSSELIQHMEQRLSAYRRPPDLVIVTIFNNNTWNLHLCSALLEGYASLPSSKQWIEKLESLRIGKLGVIINERGRELSDRLVNIDDNEWFFALKGDMAKGPKRFNPILNPRIPEERAFLEKWIEHDIAKIQEIVKSRNSHTLFAAYHNSAVNDIVTASASPISVPFCEAPKKGALWFVMGWTSKDLWHLNDRGYAKFAELIADCMESKGFVPKKANAPN